MTRRLALLFLVLGWAPGTLAAQAGTSWSLTRWPWLTPPESVGVSAVPLTLHTAVRTGWTDDRENGALWAGQGASTLFRGGVSYRRGPLRVVLAPEVTWASNGAFPLAAQRRTGSVVGYASPWLPMDFVRRWGSGPAGELHAGQSLVEVRGSGLAVGVTSANLARGAEARYLTIVGVSAPGVPSAFFDAKRRLGALGRVGMRVQYGLLHESPWFNDNPDDDRLLLTLLALDWAPAFLPGLSLGLTATYRDPIDGGLTPSMLLKAFRTRSAQTEDQHEEDAMAAAHARWDAGQASVWGTWARGDGALNVEDLLTDTDHSQLWALGARTSWSAGGVGWVLTGEASSSVARALRQRQADQVTHIYRHTRASQGHTHLGQMLGASIGPGARGQWLNLARTSPGGPTIGAEVERIVRDLDVHWEVFKRRDGSSGEDREWRFAALYEGPFPGFTGRLAHVPGLLVRANGGVSLRWNRDYIRYSENADLVGPRESQLFLDVILTWDPSKRR